MISMRNPALATLLVAMAFTGMLPLGVDAGSYRRPVLARGTVTYQANRTAFGLLGNCYDVPLFDFCTNERIGIARDCLHTPVADPDCAGGMNLTATTTFVIEDSIGNLTVRSHTSVGPATATAAPTDYTHITGSFPPTTAVNGLGILEATGIFAGATGTVRLSGAVNLDNAPNQISFSCIFLIDVQTSSDIDYEYTFQRAGSKALTQQVFLVLLMTLVGMLITLEA